MVLSECYSISPQWGLIPPVYRVIETDGFVMASPKRLYKSSDPMIAGVCGGIAEYFAIDPTLVRILTVVLVIVGFGFPVIFYLIGAILMSKDPAEKAGIINAKTEPTNVGADNKTSVGQSATFVADSPASTTAASASPAGYPSSQTSASVDSFVFPASAAPSAGVAAQPIGSVAQPTAAQSASAAQSTAAQSTATQSASAAQPIGSAARPTAAQSASAAQPIGSAARPTAAQPTAAQPTATPPTPTASLAEALPKRSHWSFALIAGVFLICIGFLILLGNLVNVSVWRFWPSVLIVIGVFQLFTPSSKGWSIARAGGAIILISFGLVLLAWMLQVIAARSFLLCAINLWPVMLIVAGLYVLGGIKRFRAFNLAASLLFSATLLLGVWYYGVVNDSVSIRLPNGTQLELAIPRSPIATLLNEGDLVEVGQLDLGRITEADLQVHGGGMSTMLGATTTSSIVVKNALGDVSGVDLGFNNLSKNSVSLDLTRFGSGLRLSALLPRAVLWNEIRIDAGAANLELDFTSLQVRGITLSTGMSACTLRLGNPLADGSRVTVNAGMSAIRIEVPRDCAVIIYTSGLNLIDVDQRYFTYNRELGAWCSKAYANAFGNHLVNDAKVWVIEQSGMTTLEVHVATS